MIKVITLIFLSEPLIRVIWLITLIFCWLLCFVVFIEIKACYLVFMKEAINNSYKYSELTGKIIGCAMKVHSALGNGFQEVVYQRALALEMEKQRLVFTRELEMKIYYDAVEVGTRRADFLVQDKVLLELKAISQLENIHMAQALNYLEAYRLEIGLLINFGSRHIEVRRITNEQKIARLNKTNPSS